MESLLDSWWTIIGLAVTGAVLAAVGVEESRRHYRDKPGTPAVRNADGNWPRLGPPTEQCASNRHYRCDGRSRVGRSLVLQCGCTCHRSD